MEFVRKLRLAAACAGALWLLVTGPARAAFDANDNGWEGTSQLLDLSRERLGRDRVVLTPELDYSQLTPADGLLIVHPEVVVSHEQISNFLKAGGRAAVLDDYGEGARLLARFRIQRAQAPLRPAKSLRQNSNLAIAVPAVEHVAGYEQGRHPIVSGVEQLVTNHPTALTHPNLTPVLEIPAINEPDATLAVTGIIAKKGRLFAMGDPSAVINLMFKYPGNRAFAQGLVDYLVEEDSWGTRGGKLYILSGKFSQRGEFGGEASLGSELAQRLESLLESLREIRQTGLPDVLVFVLSTLAGLGAVGWAAVVALRRYRRTAPRFATATPLVGQGGVAGRVAVLAAPTTAGALVLLELKSALEEGLALELGLSSGASHQRVLQEIDRQSALGQRSSKLLETMLRDLNKVAMAVAASQPVRVSPEQIEETRKRVHALLGELKQHKGGGA
jgi:hypothetical protein